MAEQLLTLIDLSKYYTGSQSVVMGLNSVSLSFSRGEFVAVTGESGSGKSTLSHVIGGILSYESGELLFNGRPTSHYDGLDWERYRRDNISFISQNYGILPGATVLGNVVSALRLAGMDKEAARTAAEGILRQVELWELRRRRAAKLSSGQKQRLSIARALAKPAPILIADEPTGNLDAENSAKVIALLARAARERLVILVTHEFDEARDLATRHIVLQDGKVASDTALRPASGPGPAPTAAKGKRGPLSPYVARLQAASRPVWTGLTACFFALTAFAVFAFLGVFIISLDDTPTRAYDSSAFRDGSTTRIVVQDPGHQPLTQADYDAILSVPYVEVLEPWSYAADAQYAYREGVDYQTVYGVFPGDIISDPNIYITVSYEMFDDAPFVRTVPVLPKEQTFLTGGRLPENFYEVVSADPDHRVGDTVELFLWADNIFGRNPFVLEMTVVGATDYGSGLYFSQTMARFLRQGMAIDNRAQDSGFLYFPTEDVEEGHFIGSRSAFSNLFHAMTNGHNMSGYGNSGDDIDFHVKTLENTLALTFYSDDDHTGHKLAPCLDVWTKVEEYEFQIPPDGSTITVQEIRYNIDFTYHSERLSQLVQVSYADFDALTWHTPSDQASLTIEDYAYTDQVIDNLEGMGYWAVSPYRLGSTQQDPELAAEREQTLKVCLIALLAVIALQIVVLRALFSVETDSYRLLSNIGLTGRTAKRSVVWQVAAFTLMGQLIGGLGIWLCGLGGIERIRELLRWLPPPYVLLLSGVHLAASLLAAAWAVRALARQVYPLTGKYSDLALWPDEGDRSI